MESPHRAMKYDVLEITENWGKDGVRKRRRRKRKGRRRRRQRWEDRGGERDVIGIEPASGATLHRRQIRQQRNVT